MHSTAPTFQPEQVLAHVHVSVLLGASLTAALTAKKLLFLFHTCLVNPTVLPGPSGQVAGAHAVGQHRPGFMDSVARQSETTCLAARVSTV